VSRAAVESARVERVRQLVTGEVAPSRRRGSFPLFPQPTRTPEGATTTSSSCVSSTVRPSTPPVAPSGHAEARAIAGGAGGGAPRLAPAGGHLSTHIETSLQPTVIARTSRGRTTPRRKVRGGWKGGPKRQRARKPPPYDRQWFPARSLTWTAYRTQVARALEAEAAALPRGKERKDIARKAWSLLACGSVMKVRECADCGTERDGTGSLVAPVKRCGLRACPSCERYRSGLLRRRLLAAVVAVPVALDHRWRFITFSPWWDKASPTSCSVPGLRARRVAVSKAIRKVVARLARQTPESGAFLAMENAHGFIHGHALVYTPWIDQAWLEAEFRKALPLTFVAERDERGRLQYRQQAYPFARVSPDAKGRPPMFAGVLSLPVVKPEGWVSIEDKGPGGRTEQMARAVLEATKYSTKSASPLSEEWVAGAPRECMDPTLAARWSLAAKGARLTEAYGVLRGLMRIEDEDADLEEAALQERTEEGLLAEEADPSCVCRNEKCSGSRRSWCWGTRDPVAYTRACHARGSRALYWSRWEPPELGVELITRPRPPP
jgi:hypothetical protein